MKPWTLLGLLLLAGAALPLLVMRRSAAASTPATTWMIGLSEELDRFARAHEGRYPSSFEELVTSGLPAAHARHDRDPWGHRYVYERHDDDPRRCRVYTLGRDHRPATRPAPDPSELVLYRIAGQTIWKRSLVEVPREWNAPVRADG